MDTQNPTGHRLRVDHILHCGVVLSDWERQFLADIGRRFMLSEKQEAKLAGIEARANGGTADPKVAFLDAMEAAGIIPAEPIADLLGPDKIRFRVEGDNKARKNGWAKFYDDGLPAGSFGCYKRGLAIIWHMDDGRELSAEDRKRLKAESEEKARQRATEREALHRAVAQSCQAIWDAAQAVDPTHGYLVAKGIAGEGLRQSGNTLLVPMYDDDGMLWSLQRIWGDGTKRYAKDGRSTGLHLLVGEPLDRIAIAEGYGTAAVVRRATGLPVAVAFTWCNLEHVARLMRDRLPDAEIIIAADDDAHLVEHPTIQRNIGLDAAEAAASAVGGRVALPPRRATV